MKRFVFASFVAFLASAATIVALARLARAPGAEPEITAVELARHASAGDCWLAIEGGVYDVTAYVDSHPAPRAALTGWCGKEATRAFADKGIGRPHSAEAREALEGLRVGALR